MPPDRSSFTALNIPNDAVPEWMGSFTLAAPPNTDLWRKPPSRDTSTAPILYTALRHPFVLAAVTVSADWELEWDQGGLVIFAGAPPPGRIVSPGNNSNSNSTSTSSSTTSSSTSSGSSTTSPPVSTAAASSPPSASPNVATAPTSITSAGQQQQQQQQQTGQPHVTQNAAPPPPPSSSSSPTPSQPPPPAPPPAYIPPTPPSSKWVKVGLEFCNNACHATSVCATSDGADWALTSLPPHHARRTDLRVKIERIGYALWVWYEDEMSGWRKLREVTWFFWGVEDKAVRVGVYASRPANLGGATMYERRNGGGTGGQGVTQRNLCVDFEGLEIM